MNGQWFLKSDPIFSGNYKIKLRVKEIFRIFSIFFTYTLLIFSRTLARDYYYESIATNMCKDKILLYIK